MRIELLDQAKDDLVDGFWFYEKQSPGLGAYFRDSLLAAIESLRLYAGIHRVVHGNCHRLLAKRFPFAVYYRLRGDTVRLQAVLDCRREPAWIRSRLV